MANVTRLVNVGIVPEQAKEIAKQIDDSTTGLTISSDDVTVGAITAANFTFAGGTLTQALQALADAIPA